MKKLKFVPKIKLATHVIAFVLAGISIWNLLSASSRQFHADRTEALAKYYYVDQLCQEPTQSDELKEMQNRISRSGQLNNFKLISSSSYETVLRINSVLRWKLVSDENKAKLLNTLAETVNLEMKESQLVIFKCSYQNNRLTSIPVADVVNSNGNIRINFDWSPFYEIWIKKVLSTVYIIVFGLGYLSVLIRSYYRKNSIK